MVLSPNSNFLSGYPIMLPPFLGTHGWSEERIACVRSRGCALYSCQGATSPAAAAVQHEVDLGSTYLPTAAFSLIVCNQIQPNLECTTEQPNHLLTDSIVFSLALDCYLLSASFQIWPLLKITHADCRLCTIGGQHRRQRRILNPVFSTPHLRDMGVYRSLAVLVMTDIYWSTDRVWCSP